MTTLVLNEDKFLIWNECSIMARKEDGLINATTIAKSNDKDIKAWLRLKGTKELITTFCQEYNLELDQVIVVKKGNSSSFKQGTWLHRHLVYSLAQWASPLFGIKVIKWIDELLLTGKVELGKEKSMDELNNEFEKLMLQLTDVEDKNLRQDRYIRDLEHKSKIAKPILAKFPKVKKDLVQTQLKVGEKTKENQRIKDERDQWVSRVNQLEHYKKLYFEEVDKRHKLERDYSCLT